MNRATGSVASQRCYCASARQSSSIVLRSKVMHTLTITRAAFSAPTQSGSSEHGKQKHNSDFGSAQSRAGVCSITFQTTSGTHIVTAEKGVNVYNAAEYAGLHLPASCKRGSCSSCVGKVLEGRVVHSHDPQCLTASLKAQGYVALCCATVVGDATILTHQWSAPCMWTDAPPYLLYVQGAKLRAARALQLDRMRHHHG